MAFTSTLRPNEIVIDEFNAPPAQDVMIDGKLRARGLMPRPFGATTMAKKFDLPLIPRSEWTDRIEEMERTKTRLSDMCDQVKLPCLDQAQTSYCWINAPTYCVEVMRVYQNEPMLLLSPASVGAPIKNYRNEGGWGMEGLDYIIKHGICTTDVWPANAIQKKYDTPESQINRARHKVQEWYELESGNFDQLMTCLLLRMPTAIGLSWWSHEISAIDPVVISVKNYGARFRNSWSSTYGSNGYNILTEKKATPDDACCPLVTSASIT